jgi:hypothetical protein
MAAEDRRVVQAATRRGAGQNIDDDPGGGFVARVDETRRSWHLRQACVADVAKGSRGHEQQPHRDERARGHLLRADVRRRRLLDAERCLEPGIGHARHCLGGALGERTAFGCRSAAECDRTGREHSDLPFHVAHRTPRCGVIFRCNAARIYDRAGRRPCLAQ